MLAAKQAKLLMVIGQNIKKHRNKMKMTQREFSRVSGHNHSMICRAENGGKNLTLFSLSSIADALGVTIYELIEGAE